MGARSPYFWMNIDNHMNSQNPHLFSCIFFLLTKCLIKKKKKKKNSISIFNHPPKPFCRSNQICLKSIIVVLIIIQFVSRRSIYLARVIFITGFHSGHDVIVHSGGFSIHSRTQNHDKMFTQLNQMLALWAVKKWPYLGFIWCTCGRTNIPCDGCHAILK